MARKPHSATPREGENAQLHSEGYCLSYPCTLRFQDSSAFSVLSIPFHLPLLPAFPTSCLSLENSQH